MKCPSLHVFVFGDWIFYGDHFAIKDRQKATFWKSELGALICPFVKVTEGQIVSWGSWAGSSTALLDEFSAISEIHFIIDKKTIYLAFLFLKVTMHLQTDHFVEILIFRLMHRSKQELI